MSEETVAIVLATFLGPIFAVAVSIWREKRAAKLNSRFHVYRTLMATRRTPAAQEHVNALNLVETEFHGEANIQSAFRTYIRHFEAADTTSAEWHSTRLDKLATLLHKISVAVREPIGEIDIRSGGYAPDRWLNRDNIEHFHAEIARGRAAFPVVIVGSNADAKGQSQ